MEKRQLNQSQGSEEMLVERAQHQKNHVVRAYSIRAGLSKRETSVLQSVFLRSHQLSALKTKLV